MSNRTDHSTEIALMRRAATVLPDRLSRPMNAAAALLEVHDATGLSLDHWDPVRIFVEDQMELAADMLEHPSARITVEPNGV